MNEPKYSVGDVVYAANQGRIFNGTVSYVRETMAGPLYQKHFSYGISEDGIVTDHWLPDYGLAPSVDALLDSLKRKFEESK